MPDDNLAPTNSTTTPAEPTDAASPAASPATNPAAAAVPDVPVSDAVVKPEIPEAPAHTGNETYAKVIEKIDASHNVLIALSGDPSVDELCAAIGLSLFLDKLGKRATAIYSGTTPNALEFLKPEDTFEPSADVLQDFVIALSKEKADHLRYKLDGDYVKVYITPFHSKISQEDLDFSYGDYNVDLVIALNVANGIDLDSALREHGRIMHDAVIINITTGNPGKFGEIEWSEKKSSSVSEMIARFLYSVKTDVQLGKEDATAFLTGIVAATNRFSNGATTPDTMSVASRLMESGANQQLISKNITPEVNNQLFSAEKNGPMSGAPAGNETDNLDIEHAGEPDKSEPGTAHDDKPEPNAEPAKAEDSALLDDLKAAEESLASASEEPQTAEQPAPTEPEPKEEPTESPSLPPVDFPEASETPTSDIPKNEEREVKSETVIKPSGDLADETAEDDPGKYGKMLEDALNDIGANPATANTPQVSSTPEANSVPEMNFMPMPGDEVLPPPPAPPLDMENASTPPTVPSVESETVPDPTPTSLGSQPAMQDQVYIPQANDPGAFKIPGA